MRQRLTAGHAEQLRGALLHAAGLAQRLLDELSLDCLQFLVQTEVLADCQAGATRASAPLVGITCASKSSRRIVSPGTSAKMRASVFCNSRTLPGHG